jgi:integrase
VDYHIGLNCESKHAVFTLRNALEKRQINPQKSSLIIRSDNGPQFISHLFEESCGLLNLEHERIPTKTPNKNAHIESFHRLLEDEPIKYKTMIYLAIYGGMRMDELAALEWKDIDFENSLLDINKSLQHLPGRGTFIKPPKNRTSNRIISLPKTVINLLLEYKV